MNSTSTSSPQWAGLRSDLLSKISKCLNTRIDILKFRAVCFSWRSSTPLPPKIPSPYSPLRLPFPIGPNPKLNPNRRGHFLIKESTIYSVQPLTKISNSSQSINAWLIKLEELSSGNVLFKDPFHRFPFKDNINTKLPEVLNFLDYRVFEISKAYGLEFVEEGNDVSELEFNEWKSTILIKKVVVSSCLDDIDDSFAIMALHTHGNLGVWRVGDKNWNNVINGNHERSHYDDIVYCNGKFYAIDSTGLTISIDPVALQVTELSYGGGYVSGGQFKYLVSSFKSLFRVDKYYLDDFEIYGYGSDSDDNCPVPLKIYKLDEKRRVWVEVEGLDDNVLFIGDDVSFSVSAKDCDGCKRNCVYYCDDSFCEDNDHHPGFDVGIFYLNDGNGISSPLSKFPGYSKIFWPPPTWLKLKPCNITWPLSLAELHEWSKFLVPMNSVVYPDH